MRKNTVLKTAMLAAAFVCAFSGFAQGKDITPLEKAVPDVKLSFKGQPAEEPEEPATLDTVTVEGSKVTVDAPRMHYELELDPELGYFCLTQDMEASRESYDLINDPEGFRQVLIDYDKHLYVGNTDGAGIWISDFGSDAASMGIQDLSSIAEEDAQDWLEAFRVTEGYTTSEIVDCGGKTWFRYNGADYMYIADGQYIWACWTGTADMTEDDAADMQAVLAGLTFAGK